MGDIVPKIRNRWLYRKNKKEIDSYLENVTHLYINEVQVRKSGRASKSEVKKLLRGSRKAFLTTDKGKLWVEIRNKDGSVFSICLGKNEGFNTSEM